MRKLEDILQKIGQNISFSKKEKESMRKALEAYLAFHPVRKEETERLPLKRSYFTIYSLQAFLRKKAMPIVLVLALLFGGGGVSYAAEGAVPGDVLYPIKVSINEEMRDLVALTPEAKANWGTRRLERRLEEAEKLVSEGAFNQKAQKVIEERIAKHMEKVEERIARIEERQHVADAAEISANLEVTLRAHKEVFNKIAHKQLAAKRAARAGGEEEEVATSTEETEEEARERMSDAEERLDSFIKKIEARAEKAGELYETHLKATAFEDAPGREVSAETHKKNALKHLETLVRLFDARKDALTPEVRARMEEGIAKAREIIAEGDVLFLNKEFEKAFLKFSEARSYAQKLAVFLKSQIKLDGAIDVASSTPQAAKTMRIEAKENNRKEAAEEALRKANEILAEVRELFSSANENTLSLETSAKVKNIIVSAEELIGKGKSAYEAGDYSTAFLTGQRAARILKDAREMIQDDENEDEGLNKNASHNKGNNPRKSSLKRPTPLPAPVISIISVRTDKKTYSATEDIGIKITAENTYKKPLILNFTSGCQAYYEIVGTPYPAPQICTMATTSVTIPGGESKTWEFVHRLDGSLSPGTYLVKGGVYGIPESGSAKIEIQ